MTVSVPRVKPADDNLWRVVLFVVFLPIAVAGIVWAASVLSDDGRVPSELTASAMETGVMVCHEGAIVHGDDSLLDRFLEQGLFRCTSWGMRGVRSNAATGAANWPSSPRR